MTIKASGTSLSFSEIATEFGYPTDNKLGNYRNTTSQSGWDLGNLPLDTGIPTSGPIKFSDFYSKQLNIVINCWDGSDSDTDYHVNAKSQWNRNNLVVVGDTNKTKRQSGSKVIIHVNKEIGSAVSNTVALDTANKEVQRGKCALRTGSNWNSDVSMQIDLGDSARLRGAGGKGGKGNNPADNGAGDLKNGREGNSALGIQFGTSGNKTIINVNSSAVLRAGFGGGGGGGGAFNHEGKGKGGHPYPGGGGGGGAGWPVGAGGAKGGGVFEDGVDAENGDAGTRTAGGAGGDPGSSDARKGGDGGDIDADAQSGGNGSGDAGSSNGGAAGGNGKALRSYGASNTYTLNNSGSIVGGIKNNCDSAQIS